MAIPLRKGHRLAMDLAVALEVASWRLSEARRADQLNDALSFNRDLWREVRRLAVVAPDLDERQRMLDAAEEAEQRLNQGGLSVAQANRSLARVLAGHFACTGALRDLLQAWQDFRRENPNAGAYEAWLLNRLDGHAAPMSVG